VPVDPVIRLCCSYCLLLLLLLGTITAASQVAIGIGQLSWAEQCFRLAVALEPNHGEALNNLGVLESRKGHLQQVCVLVIQKAQVCLLHFRYSCGGMM
jgi:hypothetical protein